jgi:hypothetical protein
MIELTVVPAREVEGTDLPNCHPEEPVVVECETHEMVRGLKSVSILTSDTEPGMFEVRFIVYDSEDLK